MTHQEQMSSEEEKKNAREALEALEVLLAFEYAPPPKKGFLERALEIIKSIRVAIGEWIAGERFGHL